MAHTFADLVSKQNQEDQLKKINQDQAEKDKSAKKRWRIGKIVEFESRALFPAISKMKNQLQKGGYKFNEVIVETAGEILYSKKYGIIVSGTTIEISFTDNGDDIKCSLKGTGGSKGEAVHIYPLNTETKDTDIEHDLSKSIDEIIHINTKTTLKIPNLNSLKSN